MVKGVFSKVFDSFPLRVEKEGKEDGFVFCGLVGFDIIDINYNVEHEIKEKGDKHGKSVNVKKTTGLSSILYPIPIIRCFSSPFCDVV